MSSVDTFTDSGRWWLPGHEHEPALGVIHFEHGASIRLELSQGLSGSDNQRHPIIYGELRSGERITLEDCHSAGSSRDLVSGRIKSQNFIAVRLFKGAHLSDGVRTHCDLIALQFEHLAEWATTKQPFISYHSEQDDDGTLREMRIYTNPPAIEFPYLDGTLKIFYGTSSSSLSYNEESVHREVFLTYIPQSPVPLADLDDPIIQSLQQFMTFACSDSVHPTKIQFTSPSVVSTYLGTEDKYQPIISYAWNNWHEPTGASQPWWSMLLPLNSIVDNVADTFSRWHELRTSAKSAFDLFFSLYLGPPLYLESRFLFAAQSLEVYHRRRFKGTVLSKRDYKARLAYIENLLSSECELASWVTEKLRFGNEISFRERMAQLIAHAGTSTGILLQPDCAKAIADTRNYHTHYDKLLEGKAAQGEDLYRLTQQVVALGWFCILRDLGLEEDAAWARLAQTEVVRAVLQWRARQTT